MNKGFLSMIDLTLNIQRAAKSLDGISGGLAALMAVGLTLLAVGLLPLVWFFDIDSTRSYAEPIIMAFAPTLPQQLAQHIAWVIVAITAMPTLVELLLPRIAERVPAVAFLVFIFVVIDAITDFPRVQQVMLLYQGDFTDWGIVGRILWHLSHIPLLLFATVLFELLFVLCIVLIGMMIGKVFFNEERLKRS